jgi:hypothetical protein
MDFSKLLPTKDSTEPIYDTQGGALHEAHHLMESEPGVFQVMLVSLHDHVWPVHSPMGRSVVFRCRDIIAGYLIVTREGQRPAL